LNATPKSGANATKVSPTEWAWQMLLLVRRWYPKRKIVAVADGGYASLKLLDRCRRLKKPITFITRLRLDAALYEPAPPRYPGQMGRPRLKGSRLPNLSAVAENPKMAWMPITVSNWYGGGERMVEIVSDTAVWYSTGLPAVPIRWVLILDPEGEFETQALLCTDLDADPERIISWFVRRWQMEATFAEVRQRLGFETQRHWSEQAIQRTAPALLGVFSVITLLAHQYMAEGEAVVRRAAWYDKRYPTFSDALALVRKKLWAQEQTTFCRSSQETDTLKVSREFIERLTDAVCYAA
jgi:DDE superfamily endonuclease